MLATDLPVAAVARLSEVLTDLPGVDLEVQPVRDYPHGRIGSHLVGYVGAITEDEYRAPQIRRVLAQRRDRQRRSRISL